MPGDVKVDAAVRSLGLPRSFQGLKMQHSQQDVCLNPPSFLGILPVEDSDSLKAVDEAPSPVWGMGRY